MLAQPVTESAAEFIALSDTEMTWGQAKAFCQQQGGRLPLIGDSNSLHDVFKGTPIDGFGAVGAPWPAGLLPAGLYWTGTVTLNPEASWVVNGDYGDVGVNLSLHQGSTGRVVCVP